MKVGRNDPCACGSGKKYKHCCLITNLSNDDELKRQRWAAVQKGLVKKLMKFCSEVYGQEGIDEAFREFHLWQREDGFDSDSVELPVFMPWFFYEWYPDPEGELGDELPAAPPAIAFAALKKGISSEEEQYLVECCRSSFSFFEILDVVPNQSLELKDILKETSHRVLEKKGTQGVQKGDIFFGKVIGIDNHDAMEATAPIVIPPQMKLQILELRRHVRKQNKKITDEVLHDFAFEILGLYRDIFDHLTKPRRPMLTNTDGHLMIPHKLIFEVEDPATAFEALCGLCVSMSREELLEDAVLMEGRLQAVEFPWLRRGHKKFKSAGNTVLGTIKIDGTKVTVEVNSKQRAKKFESEIKKRMRSGWKLKATLVESIEAQLANAKQDLGSNEAGEKEQQKLLSDPNVRAHMEKMMKNHWDGWIFESIPALGGMKPIDAAKTKDGREALDALLTQFERDAERKPMIGQTVETIKAVRMRLGM